MPVTTNEMLLRGCMLKNSNYVLGLVVYTGKESRIQMNAAKTPSKVGRTPPLTPQTQYPDWPQDAICMAAQLLECAQQAHCEWRLHHIAHGLVLSGMRGLSCLGRAAYKS